MSGDHPIILYDGLCPVCNRLNLFVLRRDPIGRFQFAPLQGAFAHQVLARRQSLPPDLDTMYVLVAPGTPEERLLRRADGVHYVLRNLGGGWRFLASVGDLLPRCVCNAAYNAIARNRYRFGRHEACPVPRPEWRDRFVDMPQ